MIWVFPPACEDGSVENEEVQVFMNFLAIRQDLTNSPSMIHPLKLCSQKVHHPKYHKKIFNVKLYVIGKIHYA